MKIIFIGCRDIDKNIGGIETYMKELISQLQGSTEVDIVLYMGSDKNEQIQKGNILLKKTKITNNKYFNKFFIGLIHTVLALRDERDADIFHYNANIAGLFSVIPIIMKKKVVYMGHGFEWKRNKWSLFIRGVNKLIDNFVISINKNILMCSHEQVEYVNKKFNDKHTGFAPSGVRPINLNIEQTQEKYIIFLGRIVKEKRVDLLLRAFCDLNQSDIQLKIVGPVEDESIVKAYKNISNIEFTGSKFGDEKYKLLINSLIYVLPSDLEGLSVSLLEAMSCRCFCLVSDIKANQEALGNCGMYFKAGNKDNLLSCLNKIIANYNSMPPYREMAYRRIQSEFSWAVLTKKIIQFYKECN